MRGPKRIKLERLKGWRMPEGAVKVDRSTKWGNPFRIEALVWVPVAMGFRADKAGRTACAVELYRRWMGMAAADGPLVTLPSRLGDLEFGDGSAASVEQHVRGVAAAIASEVTPAISLPDRPDPRELRGMDLACWCKLDQPCHADVLIALANAPEASR